MRTEVSSKKNSQNSEDKSKREPPVNVARRSKKADRGMLAQELEKIFLSKQDRPADGGEGGLSRRSGVVEHPCSEATPLK